VSIGLVAVAVGLLVPVRALSQDRMSRNKCANNLRQIALAAIQYSDDKRFFPHISKPSALDNGGSTLPTGSDVSPRCLRSLVYFSYLDDPAVFCCPESDDQPHALSERAKGDLRRFGWGGEECDGTPMSPIVQPLPNDADADKLKDLSYAWTIKGYTTNSMSASVIAGDRARRAGAGAKQTIPGNHRDGWNIICLDAHTRWVKSGSDESALLASTAPEGLKLACWDDAAAGGPAPARKAPEPDPALMAKARRLLEAGGFDVLIKSDVDIAVAGLRQKADSADAFEKWRASVKPEDAVDQVAATFVRRLDPATLDAAIAFYESPAGKQVVASQALLAKARKLAALTDLERQARRSMSMARPGEREDVGARDILAFDMIGMTSALYSKLSLENLDAAIAFYESPAGLKYAAELRQTSEEVHDLLRAWLEERTGADSPFASFKREANETSAIGALKTIATSQAIFREGDKDGNGVLDYGTLEALGKAQLIEATLASGKKRGYVFECQPGDPCEFLWWATASPEKPGESGNRYFFINHAGVVYWSEKPFVVDKKKCEIPDGAKTLGR
jgi:hypothetical protein